MPPAVVDLRSFTDRWRRWLPGWARSPTAPVSIFRWLHQRGAATLDETSDLPAALRTRIAAEVPLTALGRDQERRSADGTIKWTWRTGDGKLVESVYMPEPGRRRSASPPRSAARWAASSARPGRWGSRAT